MHYNYRKETDRQIHYRAIQKVLWVTLALNVVVAAAKTFYGHRYGFLAMKADGYHSFFDGISNVVGLVALVTAAKPPDKEHQYGHYKYETVASMGISLLLFSGAYTILVEAYHRLTQPVAFEGGVMGAVIMLVGLAINMGVTRYERLAGERLKSPILLADAQHTASDVYASLAVLAALASASLGWRWADPIISAFIGLVIVKAGYGIIAQGLLMISDASILDTEEVRRLVNAIPQVHEAHRIRSRGIAGHILMDIHVEVDPNLTIAQGHMIVLTIEQALANAYPGMSDITVHLDPHPAEAFEPEELKALRLSEEGRRTTPT